jgi:outer membrane protein
MTGPTNMRFSLLPVLLALGLARAQQPMHLTLTEAQRLAIQNNPQFSAASYTAAAANQVPNEYRSAQLPTLSGAMTAVGADNGSRLAAGGLNNPVVYDRVGTGLIANQMITDFGRTSNLVNMAKLSASAQGQVTEATRADILLATSSDYFAVLNAQAVLQVVQETIKTRQTVVDQVTALAESKLRSSLDVSFANVNLSGAKLLQVQARNDLQSAQARLATDMGLPGGTVFVLADEAMPGDFPAQADALIGTAIQNRPELKELRFRQSAAERFAKAEHDLYYPTVGVLGMAGLVPAGVAQVPGRYGAIGLNVSIPIFNGGLFKARQTEAEFRAKAVTANLSDQQNRVIRDVRIAYLNASTARDRLALTQELLQQAQLAMDLSQSRYDLGLAAIVELSQAQLNLTSAQIANTTARYEYQAQRVNVEFQAGTLR